MARVLVVDDERSIRVTLPEFLRPDHHDVEVAEGAEAALRALEHGEFDVVVSDIVLPHLSGVDLLHRVRACAPRVQVILMTGRPAIDTAAEAVRAGAFDYLVKPVSPEVMRSSVLRAARVKLLEDERERLAEENRRYQEQLEQLVEERTRALQESEQTARALLNAPTNAVVLLDADGVVLDANETTAQRLQTSLTTLIGACIWEHFSPSVAARQKALVSDVIRICKPIRFEDEHRGVWSDTVIYPVLDPAGRVGKVAVLAHDITERRRAEQEREAQRQMLAASQRELQKFSRRMLSIREEEKRSFSTGLHHELGSMAVALSSGLSAIEDDLGHDDIDAALGAIAVCKEALTGAVRQLKKIAIDLRPPDLDIMGLPDALREYFSNLSARTELRIHFSVALDESDITEQMAIGLYRIVQEALNNIGKHASAPNVDVSLASDGDVVALAVRDDGEGFDPTASSFGEEPHLGLRGMAEMAESLGGSFSLHSEHGRGTEIRVSLPRRGTFDAG